MHTHAAWAALALALALCGEAIAAEVQITVTDPAPFHVHAPGATFSVDVKIVYSGSATISCRWHDHKGSALGKATVLTPGKTHTVSSPSTKVGYYELVFSASSSTVSLADRNPGQTREYGFVVLPPRKVSDRKVESGSPFGMVHADIDDPYLTGWIKTMTWHTTGASWWKFEMDKRRSAGLIELPLVSGSGWDSDDSKAVPAAALGALQSKIQALFAADPKVLHWELGIEENLKSTYGKAFYWQNLDAKAKAVRKAATAANPAVKLIYQVVGTSFKAGGAIDKFISSTAAKSFDILSLHPYRWPDFPAPDSWLAKLITDTKAQLKAKGLTMPIWFTEVGAPHHGNPGGFFGYPSSGNKVTGLSRQREATYLIKIHVIALHGGVEKLFWYNYVDKGSQFDYAEHHFGMVDYWKFPKAVHAAYDALHSALDGKAAGASKQLSGGVKVYTFDDKSEVCLVAWIYPAASKSVPLSSLRAGLTPATVLRAVNAVGTSVAFSSGSVALSNDPVFITVSKTAPTVDAGPQVDAGPLADGPAADGPAGSDGPQTGDAPLGDSAADQPGASGDAALTEDLEGGCGCSSAAGPIALTPGLLLLLALLVGRARRRRG